MGVLKEADPPFQLDDSKGGSILLVDRGPGKNWVKLFVLEYGWGILGKVG